MENPENIISDEKVLEKLNQSLTKLEADLVLVKKREDSAGADEEDQAEEQEAGNEKAATVDLLSTEIENTKRKITWVEKNGARCASPNCNNEVSAGRRKLGGVTCPEHMNDEEKILVELEITG
jgi:hypothetical protein